MAAHFVSKNYLIWMMLVTIVLVKVTASPPRLAATSTVYRETSDCSNDDELVDLCQRCAKLTKSKIANESCCSTTDLEARRYCSDFIYFGRGL